MSGRPHERPFRGGGRGSFGGGQWMGHRGRGFRGGNRGRGNYRGGSHSDHYHVDREMCGPPHRQHAPEKLLSNLAPEAQLALTTAIINSVLKTDGREGHGRYHDRDYRRNPRDVRREGRGGYFREEQRERRHYGEDRKPHEPRPCHDEGRGHHYEREKSTQGSPHYRNIRYSAVSRRRPSPHGHLGPSRKRMRMGRVNSMDGDCSPRDDAEYEGNESFEHDRKWQREHRQRSPRHSRERNEREEKGRKKADEKQGSPDGSGGVQVTIRADGERAVNNEGRSRPRVGGRLFVELHCPHCSNQRSITFKEYKYHLGSEEHKSQLNRLAKKHSVILRKIRVQQRQEQRDIEEKWKDDKPEEFKGSITRFCNICKLAFKCPGDNISGGITLHNRSKLHRMQQCYLQPRCGPCHATFPSRMAYEYHIASISHLRERTASIDKLGNKRRSDDHSHDDEDDELDLDNFMTLDSVGEDDEVGSEHEEITGGVEGTETTKERKLSCSGLSMSDEEEDSVKADWDKGQDEDRDENDSDENKNSAVGSEYVKLIEAYYCNLCFKVFGANGSLGSRAVQRHCKSFAHLSHYRDAHPLPGEEADEEEEARSVDDGDQDVESEDSDSKENDEVDDINAVLADDPEQEKLWKEVDKDLDILQGKGVCDVEAGDGENTKGSINNGCTEVKKAAKVNKCAEEKDNSLTGKEKESAEYSKKRAVSRKHSKSITDEVDESSDEEN